LFRGERRERLADLSTADRHPGLVHDALRYIFVGDRLEGSVERANTLWRRTRHTVETTVRAYADTAVTIVRETLPNSLPKIDLPIMKKAEARAKRAAAVKRARKVAKAPAKAKRAVRKAAAKRA